MSRKKQNVKEYTLEHQKLFLSFLVSDPVLFTRVMPIVDAEHFHSSIRSVIRYLKEFTSKYDTLPSVEQIKVETDISVEIIDTSNTEIQKWFLDEFEAFCRHRSIENWIMKGPDLIKEGRYGDLEVGLKEAVLLSLQRDLGTNYFKNPKERLQRVMDNKGQIKTGFRDLDNKLYGGFNRGELELFAGGSGSGKSLFLANIGLNLIEQGYNVIYITLELSEDLVSMRLDSMVTGSGTKNLFKNLDDVNLKVMSYAKGKGSLYIKRMAEGSTNSNHIKAFLKEFQIQTGKRVDAIMLDYLDLMSPNNFRVSPSDLFVKDKYVSEELRAIAHEFDLVMITASQLNRSSVEEAEYDHHHIAGGISKINTSDNTLAIYTSPAMRDRGQYQLQFLKTRSSAGVGTKINLAFNQESLRISDLDEDEISVVGSHNPIVSKAKQISDTIKNKSSTTISIETTSKPKSQDVDKMRQRALDLARNIT